ncbi:FadR/GntR family transcriptional regulator [Cupriavidus pampae]|uniref:HTH-type transcriptional regulator LutR n=1 Tax=Cupriavidus pampae TaxID=659251 RepID=A0ABN7YLQ9_9BURK|nr:FadR/GntR family transcriptional regulator [Cupriavidus pampae]CAG9172777.1 HTH-type transcriptional regulator LutR [Cupriavidus pampae]
MSDLNVKTALRRPHLAEHIARSIEAEIVSGRLQAGDRLPTEHFLSESFGVSRNVVREAIASLRAQGLIVSRQGAGAFVTIRESEAVPRVSLNLLQGDVDVRNMFEVRAALESQAAALAASKANARQRQQIASAVERMQNLEAPTAETVSADLDFHRAVAAASGNPYLATMIGTILEPMRLLIAAAFSRPGPVFGKMPMAARHEHAVILQAITDGKPAAARDAMGQHIVNAASRFGYDITYT